MNSVEEGVSGRERRLRAERIELGGMAAKANGEMRSE